MHRFYDASKTQSHETVRRITGEIHPFTGGSSVEFGRAAFGSVQERRSQGRSEDDGAREPESYPSLRPT
jgi:hypothetical protein